MAREVLTGDRAERLERRSASDRHARPETTGCFPLRQQLPDLGTLAAAAGACPVTHASGKHHAVGFRYSADAKLRRALTDFADDSRHANPWAADTYQRARARGMRHPHNVRVLARARTIVISRCWQNSQPYNPTHHGGLQRHLNQHTTPAA